MGAEFNMPANRKMDHSAAEVFANDMAMNSAKTTLGTGFQKCRIDQGETRCTELNLADIFTKQYKVGLSDHKETRFYTIARRCAFKVRLI
jgi:hypothetical protein